MRRIPSPASSAASAGTATRTIASGSQGMVTIASRSSCRPVIGSHPSEVRARAIVMPGKLPTSAPRTIPIVASSQVCEATIRRRVRLLPPTAAIVAWSRSCSAMLSAVAVRVTTSSTRVKIAMSTAMTRASGLLNPRSTST